MPVWPFPPEDSFTESLTWRTNISGSFNAEQRSALIKEGRQGFFFTHPLTHAQFEKAGAIVIGNGINSYDVPVWVEKQQVTLSSGAGSIVLNTSYNDYRVNGKLIIWQDIDNYETHVIQSIGGSPNTITLFTTLTNNYTNAYIMPVRTCYAPNGLDYSRNVGPVIPSNIEFTCYDNVDLADSSLYSTYRSHPLINNPAVIGGTSLKQELYQPHDTLDNQISTPFFDTSSNIFYKSLSTVFHVTTQSALWSLRTFLHALYGRQKGFWLPTYIKGLSLAANVASLDTTITINKSLFNSNIESGDLIIIENDGTESKFQFTSVGIPSPDNNTEILTLSGTAGVDITATNVKIVCLLLFVRLLSDRVEMQHNTATGTMVAIACKEIPVV